MHGSSIYWFNKVRGITLLLLLMNCQQFNLVKSYRGIYILEEWETLNSYVNAIPSLPRTVAKAMSLLSQIALGSKHFLRCWLPTDWGDTERITAMSCRYSFKTLATASLLQTEKKGENSLSQKPFCQKYNQRRWSLKALSK